MGVYEMTTVQTNDNLDFILEIKEVIDGAKFYEEATEAKGKITFKTTESDLEPLLNKLREITKNYPKEEFTLEILYAHNLYQFTREFTVRNGDLNTYSYELDYNFVDSSIGYSADDNSLLPTEPEHDYLLDQAIECFRKLDVDKGGAVSLSPHKHTVEVEGKEYKLIVSKQGFIFRIESVLKKGIVAPTWRPINV